MRARRIGLIALSLISTLYALPAAAADIELYAQDKTKLPVIIVSGEISQGDDLKFKKIASTTDSAAVLLNSGGGSLLTALEIGKIIRLRDYSTAVYSDGTCASACALMWLAGTKRVIFGNGRVGFHASYRNDDGQLIEIGVGNALIGHYLSQLGYSQNAVIFATSAPPDKMLWLDSQNKSGSGIEFENLDTTPSSKKDSDIAEPPPKIVLRTNPESEGIYSSSSKPYFASSPILIRNVKRFADEILKVGYRSELDLEDVTSPRIYTGAGGHKLALSFSSCTQMNCDYLEIFGIYKDISEVDADRIVRKYALSENFANIFYTKSTKNLAVFHYIILGKDGITANNLIENIDYLAKEMEKVEQAVSTTQ